LRQKTSVDVRLSLARYVEANECSGPPPPLLPPPYLLIQLFNRAFPPQLASFVHNEFQLCFENLALTNGPAAKPVTISLALGSIEQVGQNSIRKYSEGIQPTVGKNAKKNHRPELRLGVRSMLEGSTRGRRLPPQSTRRERSPQKKAADFWERFHPRKWPTPKTLFLESELSNARHKKEKSYFPPEIPAWPTPQFAPAFFLRVRTSLHPKPLQASFRPMFATSHCQDTPPPGRIETDPQILAQPPDPFTSPRPTRLLRTAVPTLSGI